MACKSRRGAALASFFVILLIGAGLSAVFSGHFFSTSAQEPSAPGDKHALVVLVSAECKGQLEPCKCPGGTNGGWLRAETCIKKIEEKGAPTLFLYGGNLLPSDSVLQRAKPRTVGLFKILSLMDCKAMALGPGDLTYGHEYLQECAAEQGIPLVCANVVFSHSGEPAFAPYAVVSVGKDSFPNGPQGDVKVGILGLVGPDSRPCSGNEAKEARLVASDAVETAQKYVPKLKDECDLVLVLGDLSRTDIDMITENHPDLDAVISSRRSQQPPSERPPERRTVVFYSGIDLYKNLGVLNLELDDGGQLAGGDIDAELLSSSTYPDDADLKVEVAKIKSDLAAVLRKNVLSRRDPKDRTAQKAQPRQQVPTTPPPAPTKFIGAKQCGNCHVKIYEQWSKGPHARAFESLRINDADGDYDCLPCHTTGYGSSSGFITIERSPDLAGVQCESCHGLGSGHAQAPDVGPIGDARRVCISCHSDRRSPDFDQKTYAERIRHWKED